MADEVFDTADYTPGYRTKIRQAEAERDEAVARAERAEQERDEAVAAKDRERKARHAAERVNAKAVIARRTNLEAQVESERVRAERAERLVARYRKPLVDGGFTAREKIATAKRRMDDAEDRAERAEALLERLADEARRFSTEAGYKVSVATEDEFIAALEDAEAALDAGGKAAS